MQWIDQGSSWTVRLLRGCWLAAKHRRFCVSHWGCFLCARCDSHYLYRLTTLTMPLHQNIHWTLPTYRWREERSGLIVKKKAMCSPGKKSERRLCFELPMSELQIRRNKRQISPLFFFMPLLSLITFNLSSTSIRNHQRIGPYKTNFNDNERTVTFPFSASCSSFFLRN